MDETGKISTFSASLGTRMREVRGRESRGESARRFDIHPNTLAKYEDGKRKPDAELVATFAMAYGVEPAWLLTGDGPRERPPLQVHRGMRDTTRRFGLDRPVEGALAALRLQDISGRFARGDEQTTIPFPREWLGALALPEERLCAMVAPDRMNEPQIGGGDLLLIDTGATEVDAAGFYVFAREGAFLIRWAELDPIGGLILKGGPKARTPTIVDKADIGAVRVFGRVVWRSGSI